MSGPAHAGSGSPGDSPSPKPAVDSSPSPAAPRRASIMVHRLQIVALLTLLSRILGYVRDLIMARLFGLSVVADNWNTAFMIPNTSRRLFGEGALSTAFLPVFSRVLVEQGRERAWKAATAVFVSLTVLLSVLVLAAELAIWTALKHASWPPETMMLVRLTGILLPYLIFICVAAQMSAVLNALGHFATPASVSIVMNVVWLGATCFLAPLAARVETQIEIVAWSLLFAGALQMAVQIPALAALGYRFRFEWETTRGLVIEIARISWPIVIALSITQLNTLADRIMAWCLTAPAGGDGLIPWLPGTVPYPLREGAVTVLYLSERLCQFPVGVLGVTLGTVIFPQLAVHAARKDWRELSDDLTLGLQIVLAVAVPASAGLVLLSEPITAALFEGGHFGADDARRTAWAVAAYSAGVWSYIAVMLLQRGYYALGDRRGPLFNALVSVVLNAALNLLFVWPLGEAGIALSTALCGFCHLALLLGQLRRHDVAIPWRRLASTGLRTLAASAAMGAVAWFVLQRVDAGGGSGRLLRLAIPFASGSAAFLAAAWLLRIKEFWLLFQIAARQNEPGS